MTKTPKHILSKSTFVRGNQCVKSLYLNKHNKDLREDISEQLEAVFASGHQVGELAQRLFLGGEYGTLPGEIPSATSVDRTQALISQGVNVIYEATFQFEEVMVAMDIMVKDKDGWKAYEVKGSTSVKDTFVLDASVQYYVITNSGCELKDIYIVHINNQYVKQGEIEVNKLFNKESVLDQALLKQGYVKENITVFKDILLLDKAPEIEIGPHCFDPYGCDFTEHCWKDIPNNSIFSYKGIKGEKKWDLFYSNIYEINNIPDNYSLNQTEQLVVSSAKNDSTYIDKKAIQDFASNINYPVYYLDFETLFMVTIPIYDGTRPFQQIPFQYSLHIKSSKNSKFEHKEFLAEASKQIDPRINFIENLLSVIGTEGDILAYNAVFEIGILKDIKTFAPQYSAEIDNMISRFVDLMNPFRSRHYYTPSMKGSYSIKQVLPALVPGLSYQGMEIADGGTASSSFMNLLEEKDADKIKNVRYNLLKYCELDTLAMVRILEVLEKV